MKKQLKLVLSIICFSSTFHLSIAHATSSSCPNDDRNSTVVLKHFFEISKIYRATYHEQQIINYLTAIAITNHLSYRMDGGNLAVYVPGKGEHANRPTVALQSHVDMIVKHTGIKTKNINERNFQIDFVKTDGLIHSRDYKTTIGADNGLGVATMMLFMDQTNTSIKHHPPLELIFTVAEETGMEGIAKLKNIKSKTLINLDKDRYGVVCMGCVGIKSFNISHAELPTTKVPNEFVQATVSLTGLKGGHGGSDTPTGRANAVNLLTGYLNGVFESSPNTLVIHAESGELGSTSAIPTSFKLKLAIPQKEYGQLEILAQKFLVNLTQKYGSLLNAETKELVEEITKINLTFESSKPEQKEELAIARPKMQELLSHLNELPQGILTKDDAYPFQAHTFSNTSFVKIEATQSGGTFSTSLMARSFKADSLETIEAKLNSQLNASNYHVKNIVTLPPWTPNFDSWLLKLFLSKHNTFKPELYLAGIEPAYLAQLFPDLHMISMGFDIFDEHVPTERFDPKTVHKLVVVLEQFLNELGKAPELNQ